MYSETKIAIPIFQKDKERIIATAEDCIEKGADILELRIDAIERMGSNPLPYHSAFKKATFIDKDGNKIVPDSPNAYKFEAFLFDAFGDLDDMVILRVKREEEFAPVKNATGVDSPETARNLYNNLHKFHEIK